MANGRAIDRWIAEGASSWTGIAVRIKPDARVPAGYRHLDQPPAQVTTNARHFPMPELAVLLANESGELVPPDRRESG
jgi:hypothetical protein